MSKKKMIAKCSININKCNILGLSNLKSSENFVWKKTNWKKIELRLNVFQYKIYAARKENGIRKVRKLQKLVLNSYDFKKLAVRKVTQLNRGKKIAGVDGVSNLNTEKWRKEPLLWNM